MVIKQWRILIFFAVSTAIFVQLIACTGIYAVFFKPSGRSAGILSSHDNARCPSCGRDFYVTTGYKVRTFENEVSTYKTCPHCGHRDCVYVFKLGHSEDVRIDHPERPVDFLPDPP